MPKKIPLLKAMLEEMDRSKSDLQLKGFEKPFYIQYRIEDVDTFETKAEFGATEGSQHNHRRVARVTVRVGDYKIDSSGGRGEGSLQLAALDDDPIAVRSALWTATDQAYKSAIAAYAQKQAALKEVQTPPQADDFSKETPVNLPRRPREVDAGRACLAGEDGQCEWHLPNRCDREGQPAAMCNTPRRSFRRGRPQPGL